jgi:hypothetical protein
MDEDSKVEYRGDSRMYLYTGLQKDYYTRWIMQLGPVIAIINCLSCVIALRLETWELEAIQLPKPSRRPSCPSKESDNGLNSIKQKCLCQGRLV